MYCLLFDIQRRFAEVEIKIVFWLKDLSKFIVEVSFSIIFLIFLFLQIWNQLLLEFHEVFLLSVNFTKLKSLLMLWLLLWGNFIGSVMRLLFFTLDVFGSILPLWLKVALFCPNLNHWLLGESTRFQILLIYTQIDASHVFLLLSLLSEICFISLYVFSFFKDIL